MKTGHIALHAGLLCLLATGCHASELTRAEAKNLLDKATAGLPISQITASLDQFQKLSAIKDAKAIFSTVFVLEKSRACLPDASDARLATGEFVVCPNPGPEITWQRPGLMLSLKAPTKVVVIGITGIADGQSQSERLVEYTWQFDLSSFPKEIEDILKLPTRTGKALFRRYDDGWRVVEFK
jgi:hypothetical protein